jgi:hypothetical protein
MSILAFFKLLFTFKIWLSEKWDTLFPIKEKYGYNNNSVSDITVFDNNKKFEKILVEYEIKSKVYKNIYYDTTFGQIKKIPIHKIPFNYGIHKPILSIKIKFIKNQKRQNISNLIPYIKEFNQNTIFNDFLLFYIYQISNLCSYYKIYIKTLQKKYNFKYNSLHNITISNFYKLLR